ncbi:IS66 family insertion sequence element accessory protein TnpB [Methylosinus sp. Ce-a6]|uniref:IS66 family insertion sequence element accessory protein TnpB n=1 Tax=Methylosinus sp. Ce-a6 TaxID=2172005 RepID=UPI00135B07CA|nr:IS66 family insertion sequence element accessory protein TnpB [Methylosinus sp. Ce-a6]
MIIPSQGLRIVLAVRPVDFRCGHDALAALVQNKLGLDPHSGLIVVFRSKRRDRLKILLWDGTGLVLIYKRLGDNGFSWPQVSDGVLQLSRVQFEALFDGLNWKRVGVGIHLKTRTNSGIIQWVAEQEKFENIHVNRENRTPGYA